MNKIINYFKGINLEMKKVSWLNKEQLLNSTFIVLGFAALISLFLFILDISLDEFDKLIFDFSNLL